jgi:hypothetical protein
VTATLDLVKPRYWSAPDYSVTLGPEVAGLNTLTGFEPDPEQRLLLDAAFAFDPATGRSLAFVVVVIAPRQNLKTGFEKQYAMGQLFIRRERLVVWSSHEFSSSAESLRDIEALIDGSDELRRQVKTTNRDDVARHGATPYIELKRLDGEDDAPRLVFKTRTAGGGRGLSGRKVILDEAYALQAGQIGALEPIMLAQPDPQMVIGSSACRPESAVLWDYVQRGRVDGGGSRMVFGEWAAPEPVEACALGEKCTHERGTRGCGCDKPDLIVSAHSAITRERIMLQTVLDLRETMPPAEYCREVMGWHDAVVESGNRVIDLSAWVELADADPDNAPEELSSFAVEVDEDRTHGSIGAAGRRPDGRTHLELVERARGTKWITDFCVRLDREHPGATFVLDGGGPAQDLIEPLEDVGLDVVTASLSDLAAASALLVDGVAEGEIAHGPDEVLDAAVRGARKRPLRDGGFAIGRLKSTEDATPLIACVLAAWALDDNDGPNLW